MQKKLLVCGGTGFIGRNMVEAFAQSGQYAVYATYWKSPPYSVEGVEFIKADLTSKEDIQRCIPGMDVIVQAAATTSGAKDIVSKPYIHVTDNAVMNSLIFRAAFEHKVSHVIFFSCTVMYPSSTVPVKESDFDASQALNSNYFGGGWTKVYLEKMCEFYSKLGHTQFTAIRHSNIYGSHDKFDLAKSHVFGATLTKVLTNTSGKVIVWGDGSEERDLLYVSDLVDYVRLILEKQKNPFELHNVGLGESISVSELVRKIIHISGKKLDIEYDASKPSLKTKLCLDISLAKKLGWKPRVSLEEGIRKTMDWCLANEIYVAPQDPPRIQDLARS